VTELNSAAGRAEQALATLRASGQETDLLHDRIIKARAVKVETFKVGTALNERAFVYVNLALLSGRSPQIKKQLSESLLAVLQDLCQWPAGVEVQLAVEIVDMDRESYSKVLINN